MTLTEFLLERIAEDDERTCRSAFLHAHGTHMAYRLRAECEAKRRIVERLEPITEVDAGCVCDRCATLCELASVYADHPDYRDEWKP